ncbi:hypothetical protein [Paraclostridium tenue]|uniref:DnaD domain-containing protein n=1 Tax=Paraclostridium tenue TaxID=1737 RepID=A0ABN1LZ44_9FIRM
MYVKNNIGDYAKIFEENIGLINGITIDVRLFKRVIEIATNNRSYNMGYVNGILKQWIL